MYSTKVSSVVLEVLANFDSVDDWVLDDLVVASVVDDSVVDDWVVVSVDVSVVVSVVVVSVVVSVVDDWVVVMVVVSVVGCTGSAVVITIPKFALVDTPISPSIARASKRTSAA